MAAEELGAALRAARVGIWNGIAATVTDPRVTCQLHGIAALTTLSCHRARLPLYNRTRLIYSIAASRVRDGLLGHAGA